eukprot:scaffold5561_cov64-Cyclotella_meneghiniana.AAC.1
MTQPSKTFIFKFFSESEKKLHLQGDGKLDGVSSNSPDISIDQETDDRKLAEDSEEVNGGLRRLLG